MEHPDIGNGFESDPEIEALASDIREAFGSGAYSLDPRDVFWSGISGSESANPVPAETSDLCAVGSRFGDFQIVGELGRGGMGIVYRASQISLNREVALKVLPAHIRSGRFAVKRFRNEARAAGRLHHTNIVPIYAQGEDKGLFFYAMELVEGGSLESAIRRRSSILNPLSSQRLRPSGASTSRGTDDEGIALSDRAPQGVEANDKTIQLSQPLPDSLSALPDLQEDESPPDVRSILRTRDDFRQIARLIAEVADALEHAHNHGVIHRDIKPQNLLLGRDNRLHITDFGLARLAEEPRLTLDGEMMGTPSYMSPEQVGPDARLIDLRTDVYSLGVTLYELITLRRPFEGETRDQIIAAIRTRDPIAPRRLDRRIPRDLETICLRAMEKDPAGRYPTAAALATDLRRFSEGLSILSRRTHVLEKAVKWMRRHKAGTAAIAATVAVLFLAMGLGLSIRSSRRAEADRLVSAAYDRLVFVDFRNPGELAEDIDRAERLGADDRRIHVVRALLMAGSADNAQLDQAIEHLRAAMKDQPDSVEALYLSSWIERKRRNGAEAEKVFRQAEALGGPTTAAEWFFRGLACHFSDPRTAIDSYRNARRLTAADKRLFLQATLHLARAYNQRIYSTRSIDSVDRAEEALHQLIEQGIYGAYPYYLLSITHRLAAEVYQNSSGTRDNVVQEHFAAALEAARAGQALAEPGDDRPITAEAECLESMGLFEQAIAMRTKALERRSSVGAAAPGDLPCCEAYHYRWRLLYWSGRLEEALHDIEVHARCDPQSLFYRFVYPALVFAELGQMERAQERARQLALEQPNSPKALIWSAACLRLLGRSEDASQLLQENLQSVDFSAVSGDNSSQPWVEALYGFCRESKSLDEVLRLADGAASPWSLRAEAHFHAGVLKLSGGDRAGARVEFELAYRCFDGEQGYTYHAEILRVRLEQDPAWPPWIGPEGS